MVSDFSFSGIGRIRIFKENAMPIVLVHGNPETDAIWDDLAMVLHNPQILQVSYCIKIYIKKYT